MITKFTPIPGFPNYTINKYGIVRRPFQRRKNKRGRMVTHKEMLISGRIDKRSGYPVIKLTDNNGNQTTQYLHRLLALAFIANPEGKPFVNQRNGNKKDHNLDNLEWVTASENSKHALENNLAIRYQKTLMIDQCTNKEYAGIKDAADDLGLDYNIVKTMLKDLVCCFQYLQRKK